MLNNGEDAEGLNKFICLILKKKNFTLTCDFSPISLCNVINKIVAKTITNGLKLILPDIIDLS